MWFACFAGTRITPAALLLLLPMTAGAQTATEQGGATALLIAVDSPTEQSPRAERDLYRLTQALRKLDYRVDALVNPTRPEILAAMRNLIARSAIKPLQPVLVYISGRTERRGDQAYLISRAWERPADSATPAQVLAIPMSQIESWSAELEARQVTFVFNTEIAPDKLPLSRDSSSQTTARPCRTRSRKS
jgi:Caspase domain